MMEDESSYLARASERGIAVGDDRDDHAPPGGTRAGDDAGRTQRLVVRMRGDHDDERQHATGGAQ